MQRDLKWSEIHPGMPVFGVAEDHFQIIEGTLAEADMTEYPFEFYGLVESKTQRRLVIRGVWRWVCDEDEVEPEDRYGEVGRFGILRSGCGRVSEMGEIRTWYAPQLDD